MSDEREFKIRITGDATGVVGASKVSTEALKRVAGVAGTEAAPALGKLGEKTDEAGKATGRMEAPTRELRTLFGQVGQACKGFEFALSALTGVMMGSLTFGIYAVVAGIEAMVEHFKVQKAAALEAAKATVAFWEGTLQRGADARKAAQDYAAALADIIKNTDTLKTKEAEEAAVLAAVAKQRLAILEASRQVEIAAAKGDKEEEARINARYGQHKSSVELDIEAAAVELKRRHLAEQSAEARRQELHAAAAERDKEAGAPGGAEADEGTYRLPIIKAEMEGLQAARMNPLELDQLREEVKRRAGEAPTMMMPGGGTQETAAGYARRRLQQAEAAEEAYSGAAQEYEQRMADVEHFKASTAALAKAVTVATADLAKAVETARATKADLDKSETVLGIDRAAAEVIRQTQAGALLSKAGVPNNPLGQSLVSDVQAMEGVSAGQQMNAKQTEMINHLVAGLRAQGASQATINGLLLEMKDLHVDTEKKIQDIWAALKELRAQHRDTFNQ